MKNDMFEMAKPNKVDIVIVSLMIFILATLTLALWIAQKMMAIIFSVWGHKNRKFFISSSGIEVM